MALIGYGVWSSLQFAFLHIRIQGVSSIKSIELYRDQLKGDPYHADHESYSSSGPGMWVVFPSIPYRSGNNVLRVTIERGQSIEQRTCTVAFTYPRCFAEIYISEAAMRCNACVHD